MDVMLLSPRGIGSAREKRPMTSYSKPVSAFEMSLVDRFKSLVHVEGEAGSGISLAYLARAMGALSSVHAVAGSLIDRFDEAALAAYVDRSANILEFCNAASAEIDWLRCSRLHLLLAVRLLSGGGATRDNLRKAGESIQKWNALLLVRARDETIFYSEKKNAPRGKINDCAVDAAYALVLEALAAAFGSLSGESFHRSPPVEAAAATASARALEKIIQDTADTVQLGHAVENLNMVTADLTAAIDRLRDAVDSLFRFTLRARDIALVDYYHSLGKKLRES